MKRALALFMAALVLAASGCSGQAEPVLPVPAQGVAPTQIQAAPTYPPTPPWVPSPTPEGFDLLLAAAQAEGELNVIALPHDWLNYGQIITIFSRKYGITVNELDPGASSEAELKAIKAGRANKDPKAPDVIDVGMQFALQAKNDKLLQPYKVSTWSGIPDVLKDPDGYWYGDYYGIIVFEVNRSVAKTHPQDWPDLLQPGMQVALAGHPDFSYQAMMSVYSASLANGGSLTETLPGLRLFQEINHAGNLMDMPLKSGGYAGSQTVLSGETPIVLRWDFLALADRGASPAGANIDVIAPASGQVAGVYAQAISAYAPHPNAAKLWMEFLYSDAGQRLMLQGYGHPIRFAEMLESGAITESDLGGLLPSELYLEAEFPSAEQIAAADTFILGSWRTYVP